MSRSVMRIEGPKQVRDERGPDQENWEEGRDWPYAIVTLWRCKELEHRSDYGARRVARCKARHRRGKNESESGDVKLRQCAPMCVSSVTINRSVIILPLIYPCRSPTNSPLLILISKTSAFLFALTSTSLCRMEKSLILLYVPHRFSSLTWGSFSSSASSPLFPLSNMRWIRVCTYGFTVLVLMPTRRIRGHPHVSPWSSGWQTQPKVFP